MIVKLKKREIVEGELPVILNAEKDDGNFKL